MSVRIDRLGRRIQTALDFTTADLAAQGRLLRAACRNEFSEARAPEREQPPCAVR